MMGLVLKLLGGSLGPYIAGAVGAVVVLSVGAATVQTMRLDHAKSDLTAARSLFQQERRSFLAEQAHSNALERARTEDHTSAVQDANDADRACSTRVSTARKSASAIAKILNEPPHANPDPAEPELLTAGQLRNATGR